MFIHEGFHRQGHFQQIPVTVCLNGEECPSEMPRQAQGLGVSSNSCLPSDPGSNCRRGEMDGGQRGREGLCWWRRPSVKTYVNHGKVVLKQGQHAAVCNFEKFASVQCRPPHQPSFNPVRSHGGGSLLGSFTHSPNRLCQSVYLCQPCANLIARRNKMILPQRLPNQAVKTEK